MLEAFPYVLAAAAANMAGALAVTWRRQWSVVAVDTMIAVSAGFMIGVSLTDMFPEAIERGGESAAAIVLLGYLLVHLTQHTLVKHFHFGEETHAVSPMVGVSALVGLLLHTFVDGVAIASGFHVSQSLGVLVFLAILLHKLPEGLAISSLFLAAGRSRRDALLAAAALGAATILGFFLTQAVGTLSRIGLPLAAGVTLYVGASNLVPEFQAKSGWRLPLSFFAGCALYLVVRGLLRGSSLAP
jgi:ZIP family zinc transporter/zinc and cadmium transporter